MHENSYKLMSSVVSLFNLEDRQVLDIGSSDVNGTYRPLFSDYTGLDIAEGKNVDIVANLYKFPIPDDSYDLVVSGQTIEHVEDSQRWMAEVYRVTKNMAVIIGPAQGFDEHRHPVDCWRIFPDGMKWLMKKAGFCDVEAYLKRDANNRQIEDCIGIGYKR